MEKKIPRGLRNHNPLNIINTTTPWVGQIGTDGRFCVFVRDEFGYRAAFKLLRTYNIKHKLYTVRQIIARWAPPVENNTEGYIRRVCKYGGLEADNKIFFGDDLYQLRACQMVASMAYVENGVDIDVIQREKIQKGYALAFPWYKPNYEL